MGKADGGAQGLSDPFVFGSLCAIIECERMHPVPERAEEGHGRLPEGVGGKPRQGRKQGIARPAFHRGDADPLVMMPDPGVAFPVSDPATTFHEGRWASMLTLFFRCPRRFRRNRLGSSGRTSPPDSSCYGLAIHQI